MSAFSQITVDKTARLVRIKVLGFFSPGDIARLGAEQDKACAYVRALGGTHVVIIDMKGMDIQSQEAVTLFRSLATRAGPSSKRLAIVVDKSLARMQMKRIVEGRNHAFFATMAEAEEWISSDPAITTIGGVPAWVTPPGNRQLIRPGAGSGHDQHVS